MIRAAGRSKSRPVDEMDSEVGGQAGEIAAEEGGAGAPAVEEEEGRGAWGASGEGVEGVAGTREADSALDVGDGGEVREEGCFGLVDGGWCGGGGGGGVCGGGGMGAEGGKQGCYQAAEAHAHVDEHWWEEGAGRGKEMRMGMGIGMGIRAFRGKKTRVDILYLLGPRDYRSGIRFDASLAARA